MGFDSYIREIILKLSNSVGLPDVPFLGQTIDILYCYILAYKRVWNLLK